jgi:hypothetical protein
MTKDSAVKAAERIFRHKRERRSQLARLPFEKKIEILVELQKLARGIPKHADKPIWRI